MLTPIGGISFITNICIVLVGYLGRLVRSRAERTLPVGLQTKLSPADTLALRALNITTPILIFSIFATTAFGAMLNLYRDKSRIGMFDLVEVAYLRGVAGAQVVSEKFIDDTTLNYTPVPSSINTPEQQRSKERSIADPTVRSADHLTLSEEVGSNLRTWDIKQN